jgi:hypothetical protein
MSGSDAYQSQRLLVRVSEKLAYVIRPEGVRW